jgi:F-type H+-transporting ATPase subunit c
MKIVTQYFRLFLAGMILPVVSFAEEAAHAAAGGTSPWIGPGAGLAMGLAVIGAALAQGKIAAAFMEGASRNPSSVNATRTPLILSLIFVETLVLFTLLIALQLVGKA